MRILLLTWFFPPTNAIGAVRTGKFARHLMQEGHDLRVVAVRNTELPTGVPLEIPSSQVIYTPWFDVNSAPRALNRLLRPGHRSPARAAAPAAPSALRAPAPGRSRLHRAAQLYTAAINLPDRQIGWLPWALWGLRRACTDWRPDLLFASGPPFTAFLAARRASRRLGVPWVAELRDRWVDDPYDDDPPWRAAALARLERVTLGSASALVTVSEPWAEWYRQKYAKPVATIYNGFDPDETGDTEEKVCWSAPGPLTIVYTGVIYPGFRDPAPLFNALRHIPRAAERLRVVFYGTAPDHVRPIAAACGVLPLVELRPAVPRAEALRIQRAADILLLMQWTDPRDQGHIPAKLFEYLAALRPILGLGLGAGVPARLIRERAAGCFSNDPEVIVAQLKSWLAIHEQDGRVPDLPAEARLGLSRPEQYARLEDFLADLLRERGPQRPNKAA